MCSSEAEVNQRECDTRIIGKAGNLKDECAFMEHPDKRGK